MIQILWVLFCALFLNSRFNYSFFLFFWIFFLHIDPSTKSGVMVSCQYFYAWASCISHNFGQHSAILHEYWKVKVKILYVIYYVAFIVCEAVWRSYLFIYHFVLIVSETCLIESILKEERFPSMILKKRKNM